MVTLPKAVALLYESLTHARLSPKKRTGIIYRIYRRMFMRNAEDAAELLIDGIVSVKKYDWDPIIVQEHNAQQTIVIKDPTDKDHLYDVTLAVQLFVAKRRIVKEEA